MPELNHWAKRVHEVAVEKGFWDDEVNTHFILSKIALCHSELSETLEAVRKQKGADAIAEELVDTVIRVLDLYEGLYEKGIIQQDLDYVMMQKTAKNQTRPRLHGNLA